MEARTKRIWGALLLGPLTLFATPLVALIVVAPFLLLSLVSSKTYVVEAVAKALHLEGSGLGGALLAVFIIVALLAILGDVAVALLSWLIYQSRSLAALTLGSAILTQAVGLGWSVETLLTQPMQSTQTARFVAEIDSASVQFDRERREYAQLGPLHYDVRDPMDSFMTNDHPELGPIYRRLVLTVPVSVRKAGTYKVYVRYVAAGDGFAFHTPLLEAVDTLGVGERDITVEFDGRSAGYPQMWSPKCMGGRATAKLYVDVDRMKLYRYYESRRHAPASEERAWKARWEAEAKSSPGLEMTVDSAVTEFPGGVRYPANSRWAPAPKPSGHTDRWEMEHRRKTKP